MRKSRLSPVFLTLALSLLLGAPPLAQAQAETTQSLILHPGWNSVYLEVDPGDDIATLFSGVPIDSIWAWLDRTSKVGYLDDPSEGLWDQPGWFAFFFEPDEQYLTTLHDLQPNQSYLVKVNGSGDVALDVTGAPSVFPTRWVPDSFNLVGFHLDPDALPEQLPTFEEFFAPSGAHAGQAIFELDGAGTWRMIDDLGAETILPGAAYWVYTEGGSSYQAPLHVGLPSVRGLEYGSVVEEQTVELTNLSSFARTVSLEELSTSGNVLLRHDSDRSYTHIASVGDLVVEAGDTLALRLAVKRQNLGGESEEFLLKITDDHGTRVLVPVSVER